MHKATREAIETSIAHWKDIAQATVSRKVRIGCCHCTLCTMFRRDGCNGCPVVARTGMWSCRKTPYEAAREALRLWGRTGDSVAFRAAARAETEFLESLSEP